ncbi:Selenocysteine-specific elongation factor [Clonorchis sinensis]|uniref:Selenocysteine-specific elongation factor n=1 Tax=Clonorchis sinensis TaxID=79923 RepID=A0A8T1LXA2_CLOSI|nr:Selenocysteine-specific elongation factor [Clonorchis sinensis]
MRLSSLSKSMSVLNVNVGVLGHVDCGKTSLAKALSMIASTSAFDKNPQSKKRGITLDLGFSSFTVDLTAIPLRSSFQQGYKQVQFTLVDCPGHGSLIRTVLCGSQIIDVMLLVVDISKGFQTQTAECLIIGEITCDQMIVVLNKSDLLKEDVRASQIDKMRKRISKTLEQTKFRGAPIAVVSAAPGGNQVDFKPDAQHPPNEDLQNLITLLIQTVTDPTERRERVRQRGFLFAADHCFTVTGQGTVMTGTVLAGSIRVGETIELPRQRLQRKIKSIQMFRQPVDSIGPGDRAGICVPQLDPSLLERGLVGAPGDSLQTCHACVLGAVRKIPYFKNPVLSKSRFHIFIGQETVLAELTFFGLPAEQWSATSSEVALDLKQNYMYLSELPSEPQDQVWVLVEFERPVVCYTGAAVIGARLDSTSATACRLAFHGKVQMQVSDPNYKQTVLPQLCVYRCKNRRGQIDRVMDSRTCVVRGLFKRETNWDIFVGLRAHVEQDAPGDGDSGEPRRLCTGRIESSFGQSGKCRLVLDDDLPEAVVQCFARKSGKKAEIPSDTSRCNFCVVLEFKRFLFDPKRRLVQ